MIDLKERLERLPITPLHKQIVAVFAFAYFFDFVDLNTFAYAATAIVPQWKIAMGSIATIVSVSFAGMFVGAIVGGHFADRIGRKHAFIVSVLIYTIGSLLNAFSWDVLSLATFRMLTGLGLSSMTVIASTYLSEVFPARVRGRAMVFIVTVGMIGIPVTAFLSRWLVPMGPSGWRYVFVWGALGLLVLPLALRLHESPRWLLAKGRTQAALTVVEAFERAAGEVPLATMSQDVAAPPTSPAAGFRRLFSPQYRGRTISLLLCWIIGSQGFYAFFTWTPTLLVKHGFAVVATLNYASLISVLNPIGAAIGFAFVERVERRYLYAAVMVLAALCVALYGWTFNPPLIVFFGALTIVGLQIGGAIIYVYSAEIYPTDVRASGMGLAYGAGRLSNIFGPFVVSALFNLAGYSSVFLYIALCFLTAAICLGAFGIPVTGRTLDAVSATGNDPEPRKLSMAAGGGERRSPV